MTEVKIPPVGESITSGVIAALHKKTGDAVKAGEVLLTLDTDKVSTEIAADTAGVVTMIAKEGEEVKIGQVVATIDPAGAPAAPAADAADAAAPAPAAEPAPMPQGQPAEVKAAPAAAPAAEEPRGEHAMPLSPSVRRIVEEGKLDPSHIEGTGKDGRLTKEDVLAAAAKRASAPAAAPASPEAPGAAEESAPPAKAPAAQSAPLASDTAPPAILHPPSSPPSTPSGERETRKKLTPLRRKIAQHLVNAQQTAAILTTFNEVDMTNLLALRSQHQEAFTKRQGVKLGFMSFFIKAAVEALKTVPALNGRMEGDDTFVQNHYYDIGVAVGTEKGLVVPVIRDADQKSFAQIEKDLGDYAKKARDGKLQITDLQGGVFTVSNGGVYGSLMSTPILNPPQSGILGMHKTMDRPVAINGKVEIRPMMYLALSYDHRVVDGKESVTFLVRIKECIEDPARMLLGA